MKNTSVRMCVCVDVGVYLRHIRLCALPPLTNPNYFLSQPGVQSWPESCANAYLSCVTYIHMVFIIIKNRLSSLCFHEAEALACLSNTQHFTALQSTLSL